MPSVRPLGTRFALAIAHPGHELRAYGWMERARPLVCVLTDGSGSNRSSRLDSTAELVCDTGAARGSIFGRLSDRELYAAIIDHDYALFQSLADELADMILRHRIECIVGDAAEGYNSGHDAWRCVIDAAATIARQRRGRRIANLALPVAGRPDEPPPFCRRPGLGLSLDQAAVTRKFTAARSYTALQEEVNAAIAAFGEASFAREHLFPSARPVGGDWPEAQIGYESFGARRVAGGLYRRLIRYRDHIRPLAAALNDHATRSIAWAACAS